VVGFLIRHPHRLSRPLLRTIRETHGERVLIADTVGLTREEAAALGGLGLDACTSSLAWWDFRAPWLVEEYAALSRVAPVVAPVALPGRPVPADCETALSLLRVAAVAGDGVMVPLDLARTLPGAVKALN